MSNYEIPPRTPRLGAWVFAPGALMLGLGVLLLAYEELLRYLVAGLFVLVGLILLSAAWRLRRGGLTAGSLGRFGDRLSGPR